MEHCDQNRVRKEPYTEPFMGIAPIESHWFPHSIGVIPIKNGSVFNRLRTRFGLQRYIILLASLH